MLKRLIVALAALAIGLLPLTAAMADDHETPAPEPTLSEVVAAAVSDYLEQLELSPEAAAEVGQALGDLVQALADAAADEIAEPVLDEEDDEGEQETAAELEEVEQELETDEDETHGEIVSTVAHCAPRGKILQGTGLNHGTYVSAVAGGDTVVVPAVIEGEIDVEGGEEFTVETVEDAEALCEALEAFVLDLEAARSADEEVVVEPASTEAESDADEADAGVTSAEDNRSKGNKGNKGNGGKKDR